MGKSQKAPTITLQQLQKKYGLKDPDMIQKHIIFINLMALIKHVVDDGPTNKKLLSQYHEEWLSAERACIRNRVKRK
jgi:hypothetical protein